MKNTTPLVWVAVTLAGIVPHTTYADAETVAIRLTNGRQLTATIHARTDDNRLWLRYGSPSVTVTRSFDWQTIAWASHNGAEISIGQLKALASRDASPEAPPAVASRVLTIPRADPQVQQETMARRASRALGFAHPVGSVQFDAVLANWDGDVEADGLLLRLYPIDDQGRITAVRGTLEVEFVGWRRRDFEDVPRQRGSSLGRIGRWTVRVDEADFRQGSATIKLPFQAVHPEFDTDWAASGIVHVRFTVPGAGTFEHSVDGVRTRPFAPLRDATQLQSGRRFLPSERTGRGQRQDD